MRKSKVYSVSDEEFLDIVDNSISYSEILRELGLSTNGGSSLKPLKSRIEELGLDVSHFKRINGSHSGKSSVRHKTEDILIANSPYQNRTALKARLLKEGLLNNACYNCHLSSWLGEEISLHLDHINGINNDNSLNNLRLLCPNCHSQTDTYAGRNKK